MDVCECMIHHGTMYDAMLQKRSQKKEVGRPELSELFFIETETIVTRRSSHVHLDQLKVPRRTLSPCEDHGRGRGLHSPGGGS